MVTIASYYSMKQLTIRAMLSPSTWLRSGDPKQEANAISGFPALATRVSATQSATQLPRASTVNPRIAEVDESRGFIAWRYYAPFILHSHNIPVSMFSNNPNDLRMLTTSFAWMFNQTIDMTNARGTSTHWLLQCGGCFELSTRKNTAEQTTPAAARVRTKLVVLCMESTSGGS